MTRLLNEENRKQGKVAQKRLKTRSAPILVSYYPRRVTFYLGNPLPRFLPSWPYYIAVPESVNRCNPWFSLDSPPV